jgi:thioredoxin reductase (NADPH)
MQWYEVAIIGAGPIGVELAVALKRARVSYVHLEAKQVGATMQWWPPATRWFSSNERIAIAGVPLLTVDQGKATREDYLRYLRAVVTEFDLAIQTYEPVVAIERRGEGFEIRTRPMTAAGESVYRARRIVLATGGTERPRKLGVEGEELPFVSHYMEDPHRYFRKRVLVVGGRNSAVEAALRIHGVGAEVVMSYRGSEFNAKSIKYWLYPEIMGLIRSGRIRMHFNTTVRRIMPGEVELARCEAETPLFATREGAFKVAADFVLLMVGYVADMSLAKMSGVALMGEEQRPVFDERTMETNVPGVYVAGTVVAGTQSRYRVFLENCHVHVSRIVAAVTGAEPPAAPEPAAIPES